MFTHILGSTQRKDVKRHDLFWDGAAQVDWCIDQKMAAEDIYLSLSRNIQNVCLGQHTKTPKGGFFSPLRSVFFFGGIVFGVEERGIVK